MTRRSLLSAICGLPGLLRSPHGPRDGIVGDSRAMADGWATLSSVNGGRAPAWTPEQQEGWGMPPAQYRFSSSLSPEDVARVGGGDAEAVPFLDRTDGQVRACVVAVPRKEPWGTRGHLVGTPHGHAFVPNVEAE